MDTAGPVFIADVPSAIVCVLGASSQVFLGRRLRVPAALNYCLPFFLLLLYFVAREGRTPQVWGILPPAAHALIPPAIVLWSFCLVCIAILVLLRDAVPPFRSERRQFLRKSTAALCLTPAAVLGGALITRKDFRVREIDLSVPDLPKDLQGLRLIQLSDIHLGSFFSANDLARVVAASNSLRGDLVFVTGDLITTPWDPLDRCLLELGRLRSSSGVWGCMGNHERYCRAEAYAATKARQFGIQFLRHDSAVLTFGASRINLVGVDYQPFNTPYLNNVEQLVSFDSFNLLLSHNPDVFPTAARKGFDLILAGHTHGGQVNVEILGQNLNVTDFFTPYTKGLYTLPTSSIYVNSGLGTIGMPVRLGAPPEIAVIRLVRAV
jgi:uncharacterized protein